MTALFPDFNVPSSGMRKLLMVCGLAVASTSLAATFLTISNVTLRERPAVTARKLAVIPAGTQLTMACIASWCRTTYKGKSGYVAKAYAKALTPTTSLVAPATPAQQSEVYYANCTAARAAGAAPIYAGQPGYRPKLDRDGDGIACE